MIASESLFAKVKELIGRLIGLSLTNTKPHYINDTVLRSNIDGYAIQAINSDVTFTTLDVKNEENGSNGLVNITLPAGAPPLYINIKNVKLKGGDAVVYTL